MPTSTNVDKANTSSPTASAKASAALAPNAEGTLRARSYKPSMQRVYAFSTTQATSLADGAGSKAGGASKIALRIDGDLAVAYVENSGPLVRLRGTLRAPQVSVVDGSGKALDAARKAAMERELLLPFFITLDASGEVADVHVRKGLSSIVRGLVRSVAASMQVVDREGSTWREREQDTTGEYEATYVRGAKAQALTKTKTRYTRLAGPTGLLPLSPGAEAKVTSTAAIVLDDAGWIASLHTNEEISMNPGRGMATAHATSETTLNVIGTSDDPTALGSFARERDGLEDAAAASAADALAAQRQSDELLVAGATFASLSQELAATPGTNGAALARIQTRLGALMRLDPSTITTAEARIRNGAARQEADALVAAMGSAATPAAQGALAHVLEDGHVANDVRIEAAMSLAVTPGPTAETAESLQRASNDHEPEVAHTSSLALGGVARELREADPDAARTAVDSLLTRLDGATDTEDNVVLLRALGNAGDPRVLPYAERAMANSDPVIRMAAVAAVRFLAAGPADTLVGRAMTTDGDDDVRQEAVSTATFRPLDAQLTPLADVLRHDKMEKVRLEAVRTLAPVHRENADVDTLLHEAAKSDPSNDVRALAVAALSI